VKVALCAVGLVGLLFAPLFAEAAPAGRFESLGIPVRVGGLIGCVAGRLSQDYVTMRKRFVFIHAAPGTQLFICRPRLDAEAVLRKAAPPR